MLVGLVSLLSGCGLLSFFQSEPPVTAITIVQQMEEARPEQPPGVSAPTIELPVRINYAFKSKPAVGVDLEMEIEYMALKPLQELKVGYTASDGLELTDGAKPTDYSEMKKFDIITQRLVMIPRQENHFFVNLFVVTKEGDKELGKKISVPIAVGRYSLQTP